MGDTAFASYVKQPRRFFRTILPNMSRSLDRILIRIFCLDPAKRVTLAELRNMFLGCRSFTTNNVPASIEIFKPVTPPTSQQHRRESEEGHSLLKSKSFENTVMAYIGDYIDDDEAISYGSDFSFINSYLNDSNISSFTLTSEDSDPPTPRNDSPQFIQFIDKKQLHQFDYLQEAAIF